MPHLIFKCIKTMFKLSLYDSWWYQQIFLHLGEKLHSFKRVNSLMEGIDLKSLFISIEHQLVKMSECLFYITKKHILISSLEINSSCMSIFKIIYLYWNKNIICVDYWFWKRLGWYLTVKINLLEHTKPFFNCLASSVREIWWLSGFKCIIYSDVINFF